MKKLNLLDQSTSFKVNDTGTIIPFNAFENNQPFGVTENETSVFRIKNDMGFLKAVNATSAAGGYIFQLNTKDLVGLVPGTYEIELVITDGETNAELIFPDTGFCSFNITTSALTVTGTQIPTMSLDSFKQQLQQYVQIQADTKIQQIKSDFDTYVESVKQGPAGPQGDPGADGKPASIVVGSTKTGDVGSSASVTNVGTSTNAILNFTIPQGPSGSPGSDGKSATVSVGETTTASAGQSASVTNSGTDSAAILDFVIPAGPQGAQGPEGTIGDYVTGTGWQNLAPYMNAGDNGVWTGWNGETTGDLGYNRYAVTSINGQDIFWFRIHSKMRDASVCGTWGTKLFDIPQDVQKQYGGMEMSQYNTMYECSGLPCMYQVVGSSGSRYVQTLGYLELHYNHNGDKTIPVPSGAVNVNMEGWFVL